MCTAQARGHLSLKDPIVDQHETGTRIKNLRQGQHFFTQLLRCEWKFFNKG